MGGVSHGRRDAAAADVCILPDRPGDRRDQADRQGSSGGSGEDEQAPEREYERLLHPAYGREEKHLSEEKSKKPLYQRLFTFRDTA